MNQLERKMVRLLTDLRTNHSVTSLKMEFESGGTRLEEAMRYKEVSMAAGLTLTTKIGGGEAVSDMYAAAHLGTRHLVAPMIETPYALKKFTEAVRHAFAEGDREDMEFYFYAETITAVRNIDDMLEVPGLDLISGVVIGRSDLLGSMRLPGDQANSPEILTLCTDVARKAKAKGKKCVLGGWVNCAAMPFIKAFPPGHLDKYETSRVVFHCPSALDNGEEAFSKAAEFEYLWIKNRRDYYGAIYSNDDRQVKAIEARQAKKQQ